MKTDVSPRTRTEKKRVCVTLPKGEHDRLSRLAAETARTPAGYLRWLLHRHFREQDRK